MKVRYTLHLTVEGQLGDDEKEALADELASAASSLLCDFREGDSGEVGVVFVV